MRSNQDQAAEGPGSASLWTIRIGAAFVALMAGWRAAMTLSSMIGGYKLAIREAALSFMWVPDLLFFVAFGYLALAAHRAGRRLYQEIALVTSGLQLVFLLATLVVFRRWTDAEALGFDDPLTWLHVLLPSLWCCWLIGYTLLRLWRLKRAQAR